jgi:hypothetical protein
MKDNQTYFVVITDSYHKENHSTTENYKLSYNDTLLLLVKKGLSKYRLELFKIMSIGDSSIYYPNIEETDRTISIYRIS